jgi:hypothetical protein
MCTHVDVLNQEKHSCPTTINIEMIHLLIMLWILFIHIYWNYSDNHVYFISILFMGCSSLVIGEGLHGSNPQLAAQRVPGVGYKWSSLGAVCPIFYICPTLFTKIFYICPICR